MASEMPQDLAAADSPVETARQSVWRNEWQWVALAWLGGAFIGGYLLTLAFTSHFDGQTVALVAGGGIFLAVAPGLYATLQTWHGRRRSMGQGAIWPWGRGR